MPLNTVTNSGMPLPNDLIQLTDSVGTWAKSTWGVLGLDAPAEGSTTVAGIANEATDVVLGDGTSSNPGILNVALKNQITPYLSAMISASTWPVFVTAATRSILTALDNQIRNSTPSGWSLTTTTQIHSLDPAIQRLNGFSGPVIGTPATGTLTAISDVNGALPTCTSGTCPKVVYSLVGASDGLESVASAECTGVAIGPAQSALNLAIAGVVPAGVFKCRVYRSLYSGSGYPHFWCGDWVCVPGSSFPTIKLELPDAFLRLDISEPVWNSVPLTPAFAAAWALAWGQGTGLGFGGGASTSSYSATGMLTPVNVALSPSNALLGLGNQPSTAIFSTVTVTGASTCTITAGAVQTVNAPTSNTQGFAGATSGIQIRTTSAMVGGTSKVFTATYQYYAAATGWGVAQTSSTITPTTITGALGEIIPVSVPSGRIVISVTPTSVSGAGITAGTVVFEAVDLVGALPNLTRLGSF